MKIRDNIFRKPGALVISGILMFALLAGLTGCAKSSEANDSPELPDYAYSSQETLEAYRISTEIPEVLAEVACYCGCGETQGHRNLKDCFVNDSGEFIDHASNCHVCASEAIDVANWHDEGFTPEQISQKIDDKYHEYGSPTIQEPQQSFEHEQQFEGGPRILFANESADMGEMTLAEARSYSFAFTNVGDEPLIIADVSVRAVEGC